VAIYIALLRGINVGGNKLIKMEKLRQSFEALRFEQVKTFIQSGNVIFKTPNTSTAILSKRIADRLLSDFGFPVSVMTRTAAELSATVAGNPFLKEPAVDPAKLYVMFLSDKPTADAVQRIATLTIAPDRFQCVGREIYLHLPNGAGESKFMKSPLDRMLSAVTTTRNWKTVNAIHQMCQDCR
jgi:uncharacterized protein (DUF1697 family)